MYNHTVYITIYTIHVNYKLYTLNYTFKLYVDSIIYMRTIHLSYTLTLYVR